MTDEFDYNIEYHRVDTPGDTATIVCKSGILQRLINSSLVTVNDSNIVVQTAKDQGKYMCISNDNQLSEIHYVLIKDYEPIQYIMPTSKLYDNVPFRVGMKKPPPLCAVYSLLNLTNFEITFKNGLFPIKLPLAYTQLAIEGSLYVFRVIPNHLNGHNIQGHRMFCNAATKWEDTSTERYRISFISLTENDPEQDLLPSLCVTISLSPTSMVDTSIRINCLVYSDIAIHNTNVTIMHTASTFTKTLIPVIDEERSLFQNHLYYIQLDDIDQEQEGTYTCIARIRNPCYNLTVSENVTITDIASSSEVPNSETISSSYDVPVTATSSTTAIVSSSPASITPIISVDPEASMQTILISVIAGSFVIVTIILVIIVICIWRVYKLSSSGGGGSTLSNNPLKSESKDPTLEAFEILKIRDMESVSVSISFTSSPSLFHQLQPNLITKLMNDCLEALKGSDLYIPQNKIVLEEVLGSGAFGTVKKAKINDINGCSTVAVKMLKST
jgi:hypothetical protein